jgi:hypothetical protein
MAGLRLFMPTLLDMTVPSMRRFLDFASDAEAWLQGSAEPLTEVEQLLVELDMHWDAFNSMNATFVWRHVEERIVRSALQRVLQLSRHEHFDEERVERLDAELKRAVRERGERWSAEIEQVSLQLRSMRRGPSELKR